MHQKRVISKKGGAWQDPCAHKWKNRAFGIITTGQMATRFVAQITKRLNIVYIQKDFWKIPRSTCFLCGIRIIKLHLTLSNLRDGEFLTLLCIVPYGGGTVEPNHFSENFLHPNPRQTSPRSG